MNKKQIAVIVGMVIAIIGCIVIAAVGISGMNQPEQVNSDITVSFPKEDKIMTQPTPEPIPDPTIRPTTVSTPEPTPEPTIAPTPDPTPTPEPTLEPTPQPSYTIRVKFNSASLDYNDHVGNSWGYYIYVNEEELKKGATVEMIAKDDDSFDITCFAYENDNVPDEGSGRIHINVNELKDGKNTFEGYATVTENRGRYSGNSAGWIFKITVTKTDN